MADKYVTVGGELMKIVDRIAELITPDGVNLTTAGEKFAAWLAAELDGIINKIPPQVEALNKPRRAVNGMRPPPDREKEAQARELERLQTMLMDYRGMVLASQSFTPASYFKTFPDDTWAMWGLYSAAMQQQTANAAPPADTTAAESVSRAATGGTVALLESTTQEHKHMTTVQLTEGYRLTPQGDTLMKFLSGHIINTPPGLSYYQEVQRLKMTRAVDWMRQNSGAARSLWEVYLAHVKQTLSGIQENQQFAEELRESIGTKPALVKGRDLTTDGKALVAWLERVNPQTIHALRYQTYTRSGSTSPAEFMRIFEGGAYQLWDDMCRDVSARAELLAQEAVENARAVGLTG